MKSRLFAHFHIDYAQWLALSKAFVRKDFRQSAMSTTLRHGQTGKKTFLVLIFFYLITGLIFIPIVFAANDAFWAVFLLSTYNMFMIGGLILVEYHSVIISTEDYLVLGYQPVDSSTFFFAKFTNVLFYVLVFSLVLSLPAIVAVSLRTGFEPSMGLAAFLSVLAGNISATLAVVLFYTVILKHYSYDRLQNLLSLFQILMAFFIYMSFFIIPRLLQMLTSGFPVKSKFLYWLPPAWFSSYVKLWQGPADSLHWFMALVSVLVLAGLAALSVSRLSLHYSETLSKLVAQKPAAASRRRLGKLFFVFARGPEERVVSKLIRNQFLHDNKFKMAVLGILPLTIFYLFVSVSSGPLPNPFVSDDFNMTRTGLLYLLIFLFPMMLRTYVTSSDSYQASWIFYTTPTRFNRVVLAEKNFLMIYFVLPFLALLGVIFYYYFHDLLQVLIHALLMGLLAHLFLQLAFLYSPDLPFSRPNIKGGRSKNLVVFLISLPFVTFLGLPWIFKYIYRQAATLVVFSVTVFAISLLLEKLIAMRVKHHMARVEFSG